MILLFQLRKQEEGQLAYYHSTQLNIYRIYTVKTIWSQTCTTMTRWVREKCSYWTTKFSTSSSHWFSNLYYTIYMYVHNNQIDPKAAVWFQQAHTHVQLDIHYCKITYFSITQKISRICSVITAFPFHFLRHRHNKLVHSVEYINSLERKMQQFFINAMDSEGRLLLWWVG